MSTHAAVFIKNDDGTYTGTEICNDGYIEIVNKFGKTTSIGAGYILQTYWTNRNEVEKLVKNNAVRNLGYDYESTEFYDWRQNILNSLSFQELKELGCQYIYIFNNRNEWWVMNNCSNNYEGMLLELKCFLDHDDPDGFIDDDSFWN